MQQKKEEERKSNKYGDWSTDSSMHSSMYLYNPFQYELSKLLISTGVGERQRHNPFMINPKNKPHSLKTFGSREKQNSNVELEFLYFPFF